MNTSKVLSSFTSAEADMLRKGIAKRKCLSGDTLITLSDGSVKRIDEMSNEKVIGSDTKKYFVDNTLAFHKNGIQKTYDINTKHSGRIRATGNHRFLTVDGWKTVSELIENTQKIATPNNYNIFGYNTIDENELIETAYLISNNEKATIDNNIMSLNKDQLSLFIGILYSVDGIIQEEEKGIEYNTRSKDLAYRIHNILRRFGIIASLRENYHDNDERLFYMIEVKGMNEILKFNKYFGEYISSNKKNKIMELVDYYTSDSENNNTINEELEIIDMPYFWDDILSIEEYGKEETYEITCNSHMFIANSIISHNSDILETLKDKFISQGVENGHKEEILDYIWEDKIVPAGSYAFNKSHAVAYAIMSYYTAWLLYYYPTELITTYLNIYSDNRKALNEYIMYAKQYGMELLIPDINLSGLNFSYEDDYMIRIGLSSLKGIGEGVSQNIIDNRPYHSMANFISKNNWLNKKVLESLIYSGSLDSYISSRTAAIEYTNDILQLSKFTVDSVILGDNKKLVFPDVKDSIKDLTLKELEITGLFVTRELKDIINTNLDVGFSVGDFCSMMEEEYNIETLRHEQRYYGILNKLKITKTKKGDKMVLFELTDGIGNSMRCVMFPKQYAIYQDVFSEKEIVSINGKCNDSDSVIVSSIVNLE